MSLMEYQVLEKVKSRIASIKANWGFPATTPLIDKVLQATSQVRARIQAIRAKGILGGAPTPAPTGGATASQVYYQVPPEEKPRIK